MAYQLSYTDRFVKNYKKLSKDEQKQVKKKMQLFTENPTHPSLRSKRV